MKLRKRTNWFILDLLWYIVNTELVFGLCVVGTLINVLLTFPYFCGDVDISVAYYWSLAFASPVYLVLLVKMPIDWLIRAYKEWKGE